MTLRVIATFLALCGMVCAGCGVSAPDDDPVRRVQVDAIRLGSSPVVRWGPDPQSYVSWHSHTNRLVPVYVFGTRGAGPGIDLDSYLGASSIYRDEERLRELYGRVPTDTVAPDAVYGDQTQLAALQRAAIAAATAWTGTRRAPRRSRGPERYVT